MADYEVSKIMWVAIVVALAASIFVIAKPQISTLAGATFDNVENVIKGIDTGSGNDTNDTGKGYPEPGEIKTIDLLGLKMNPSNPWGFLPSNQQDVNSYETWLSAMRTYSPNAYLTNAAWDPSTGAHVNVTTAAKDLPENFISSGLPTVVLPMEDIIGKFDMTKVKSIDDIKVNSSTMYLTNGVLSDGKGSDTPSMKQWGLRYDIKPGGNSKPNADVIITFTLADGTQKSLTYTLMYNFG